MKLRPSKTLNRWFFEYNSIWLALAALFSFLFYYYSLSAIDAFKDYEQIDFFCEAEDWVDKDLTEEILSRNKDTIGQVNRYVYPPSFSQLGTMYEAYGPSSDLLVLSGNDLEESKEKIGNLCAPLTGEITEAIASQGYTDLTYYTYDSIPYAIQVYAKDDASFNTNHRFTSWLSFQPNTDDFYLLLNVSSNNAGSYNKEAVNDAAVDVFLLLLERYA